MRKSGLHKQIASIFDGVPMPKNNSVSEETDPSSVLMQPQKQQDAEASTEQDSTPVAPEMPQELTQNEKQPLAKRLTADPSECTSAPSIQVDRPMPLPKSSIAVPRTSPGFSYHVRKALFGAHKGPLNARQKKMAVLVGILSIVFGVVMFASLGGIGRTQAIGAEQSVDDSASSNESAAVAPQDWKKPEPLPADLRNATIPVLRGADPEQVNSAASGSGELVVKGIVFSQNKPSAIINNQIFTEGQSVRGAQIIKITKEYVEFEADGNRWTQNVQR